MNQNNFLEIRRVTASEAHPNQQYKKANNFDCCYVCGRPVARGTGFTVHGYEIYCEPCAMEYKEQKERQ